MREREMSRGPGCVPVATAWVVLVVLAPFAAVVRTWRRWRRGSVPEVRWTVEAGSPLATVDLTVDVPTSASAVARRGLVDTVVRVAEALGQPDDRHYVVWRNRDSDETVLTAMGGRPQELARRLDTVLSHRSYERGTQLWLTLPEAVWLTQWLDPPAFDPEWDRARSELIARAGPRWAMETSFAGGTPATLYRLRLHLPRDFLEDAERLLTRLRGSLAAVHRAADRS